MKITKLGHCCLLIKENGLRILTDPGAWTESQNNLTNIHVILITHEHADHFHIPSIQMVLKNNPEAKIITNEAVGKLLSENSLTYQTLVNEQSTTYQGVLLEAFGQKHEPIYPGIPVVENTGYFIGGRFWYPGDAFLNPQKPVEILALPVCGPWLHISQSVEYAKLLKPKVALPVHDGMLKINGPFHAIPQRFLKENDIEWLVPKEGEFFTV
jgi:L-ascorbate metabolism protein UlaG (beta-lactamase superfamily)